MIHIKRSDERHFSNRGWLKTYWLFSFSDYHDPENIHFGSLRVFNDDLIEAEKGFPEHRHEEMEIVTIVLDGELTHQDNMGNRDVVKSGQVQWMSAGTGVIHSEFNNGDKPVHLYQIWIFPRTKGLQPEYHKKEFSQSDWKNNLLPVASGQDFSGSLPMQADATIFKSHMDTGKQFEYRAGRSRHIFVYLNSGKMMVNGKKIERGDQAQITDEEVLEFRVMKDTEFVMIDVPPYNE